MADQKQIRALAKGRFTRAEKALKNDIEADENTIPLITIERHQKEYIDWWNKVQDLHDEYVLSLENATEEQLETEEAWLEELATRFTEMELKVDTLVEKRKNVAALSSGEPATLATGVTDEGLRNESVETVEIVETNNVDNERNNATPPADTSEVTEDPPALEELATTTSGAAASGTVTTTTVTAISTAANTVPTAKHHHQPLPLQQQQQPQQPQQIHQPHSQVTDMGDISEQQKHIINQQQQKLDIHKQKQILELQLQQLQQVELEQQLQQTTLLPQNKPDITPSDYLSRTQPISRLKIKPLDIHHFAGDIRKFAQFKDEFNSLIKPLCAPNQLALALRNHLTEDVRAAVDSVGNDYEKIWKRLELKYGNTRRLVEAILRDVKMMQIEGDEIVDALEMIDVVEKAHLDLEAIGEEEELYNATIISLIEERMPTEMRSEWVKRVAGEQHLRSQGKFHALLELLKNWRYRLEYLNDTMRATSAITLHIQGAANKNHQKQACWIHKESGDHPIWRCRVFRAKSVDERVQLTKDNHACFTCLEIGHGVDKCNKKFVCKIDDCNQNHNQLLHKGTGLPPGAVLPQQ